VKSFVTKPRHGQVAVPSGGLVGFLTADEGKGAGRTELSFRAIAIAVEMASRARGLLCQQRDPRCAAMRRHKSSGSWRERADREAIPTCSRRRITVGPICFPRRSCSLSSALNCGADGLSLLMMTLPYACKANGPFGKTTKEAIFLVQWMLLSGSPRRISGLWT